MNIYQVSEPTHDVPRDSEYRLVDMAIDQAIVSFSYAKVGDAMTCHLATDKKGKRYLRRAAKAFCGFIFNTYKPVAIVIAVGPRSVVNLALKCGFIITGGGESVSGDKITVLELKQCHL